MRQVIFGSYNTYDTWGITLTGLSFSAPVYKSNLVDIPGADGALDLSTALTDGEPKYSTRTLTTTFEISSGTRATRETLFSTILNALDGRQVNITLPDDPAHYITGRAHVAISYNDPAHGALTISAVCDPWRYNTAESTQNLTASGTIKPVWLNNIGRKHVIPTIVISGTDASVRLKLLNNITGEWTAEHVLSAGTYQLPDFVLLPGSNVNNLNYSGSGSIVLTWRGAVL